MSAQAEPIRSEELSFEINYKPGKIGGLPVVKTEGFVDAGIPEFFMGIIPEPGVTDYTAHIVGRAQILGKLSEQIVDDPNVIKLGLINGEGEVIGFNHKAENEMWFLIAPVNVKEDGELPHYERIMLSVTPLAAEAIKDVPSDIAITVYE